MAQCLATESRLEPRQKGFEGGSCSSASNNIIMPFTGVIYPSTITNIVHTVQLAKHLQAHSVQPSNIRIYQVRPQEYFKADAFPPWHLLSVVHPSQGAECSPWRIRGKCFTATMGVCSYLPSCSMQLLAASRPYVFCLMVVPLVFPFSSKVSNKLPDPFQRKSL